MDRCVADQRLGHVALTDRFGLAAQRAERIRTLQAQLAGSYPVAEPVVVRDPGVELRERDLVPPVRDGDDAQRLAGARGSASLPDTFEDRQHLAKVAFGVRALARPHRRPAALLV